MSNIYSGKVLKGPLRVRKNPEIKPGNIVNIINKDRELIIYEIKGDWARHDQGGWSIIKENDDIFIDVYLKEAILVSKLFEPTDISYFRFAFDEYDNKECKYNNIHPSISFDDKEKDKKEVFEKVTEAIGKALGDSVGSKENEKKYYNGSNMTINVGDVVLAAVKNNSKWTIRLSRSQLSTLLKMSKDNVSCSSKDLVPITDPNKAKTDDIAELTDFYNTYLGGDSLVAMKNNSAIDLKSFITETPCIFGMPYQFDEITDPRGTDSIYGKKYIEKMLVQMPLLYIAPGSPKFLPGADKGNVITALIDMASGTSVDETALGDLFNDDSFKDQKYYTFEYNATEYFKYVDGACALLYSFLNLDDFASKYGISDNTMKNYKDNLWETYQSSSMQYLGAGTCLGFYMDSETQTSESFSNASGESSLASTINEAGSTMNELQFLVGAVSGENGLLKNTLDTLQSGFDSFMNKWAPDLGGNLKARLTDAFGAIVKGGKMIFPKIWQDSSFSRSYSCSFKLSTPDADDFSWFLNIGVPYLHLVCLTAPRQLRTNSFTGPFLVRAYSKGFMNVDMGLISSLSITKGDKCKWNLNGLPMEVDVSIEIEDLYTVMSISKAEEYSVEEFMKNTAMMDYIANMCGVNISKPDIWRHLDILSRFSIGGMSSLNLNRGIKNLFLGFAQGIDNMINSIYNK